jgi:signal transduction histidine kinase
VIPEQETSVTARRRSPPRSALATTLAVIAVALVAGSTVALAFWGGDIRADILFLPAVAAFPVVGAVIARHQPANPIGWLFIAMGVSGGIGLAANGWIERELPGAEWALVPSNASLVALGLLPFVLLLFPTGELLSRRWRWAGWLSAVAVATLVPGYLLSPVVPEYEEIHNPLGIDAIRGSILDQGGIGWGLLILAMLVGAASLVLRFRRSRGDERQQLRWLAPSALLIGVGFFLSSAGYEANTWIAFVLGIPFWLGFVTLPIAVGIAILKYRLYEIDVVIKKTVVFAILVSLLMAIAALGALAVGGPLADRLADRPEALLLVGAAFGLLIWPVYRLSARMAERLVFRGRASPYEVLRTFASRVGETFASEDVLRRMARILAEGTRAERARVWVRVGDELRVEASWPVDANPVRTLLSAGSAPDALDEHTSAVRHRGELLGALSVSMPVNDPMNADKAKLVDDLAAQAGLVLRNVRLIEELRESRRRIVASQDERAKKLERNIHDGAQQQLVALAVKQRLASSFVGIDDERARALLDELQRETNDALVNLRDLARGIYPPLLADKGLAATLEAHAAKSPVPTTVDADVIGRFPQDAEGAVYFSVLEALQNTAKYSEAQRATVTLRQGDGVLSFEVTDDGRGFDLTTIAGGTGLQGMRDRMEAVGGEIRIESRPGQGTKVRGVIPVDVRIEARPAR